MLFHTTTPEQVDTSQEAADNFVNWYVYELGVQPSSATYETAFEMAMSVCMMRASNVAPQKAMETLKDNYGFSATEAAAVVRGAMEALCSQQYNTGFRTYFDTNVQRFMSSMSGRLTFPYPPNEVASGTFMALTCYEMMRPGGGGTHVYDSMVGYVNAGKLALTGPQTTQEVMYILINLAVASGCSALTTQLPPVIQMAVRS